MTDMTMSCVGRVVLSVLLIAAPAGATTAKEWQSLSHDEQRGFVSGTVETLGYAASIAIMAGQGRFGDFFYAPMKCIVSLDLKSPTDDLHALVTRYVKSHPDAASQDASRVIRTAIVDACEKR